MRVSVCNEKLDQSQILAFAELASDITNLNTNIPQNYKGVFSFKGRKSPHIAEKIIDHLTTKGQAILDPFAGSGGFAFVAAQKRREVLAIELCNYVSDVVYTLLRRVDYSTLENMFQQVREAAFDDVMSLYETRCCGVVNHIRFLFFDPEPREYYNPCHTGKLRMGRTSG